MPRFSIINAREKIVDNEGNPTPAFYSFCRSVWNALNSNAAKINVPTGGETVDTQARQAIKQIISILEQSGLTRG